MTHAIDPRFIRVARRWLCGATVACATAPMLLPFLGSGAIRPLALLPMLHCFAFWAVLFVGTRHTLAVGMRLRLAILRGNLGASDEAVRQYKASVRPIYALIFWPFLLTPFSWIVLIVVESGL
jgi:hypothetical protein